ncbi:MAG: hypothetical protein HRU09_01410 [Oligoflexales bacterium]|nr:hypothetical protein [Oligoflexales bacterium]
MKSWLEALKNNRFERKDRKMIKRFLGKTFNQSFLPMVELLKKYDLQDEAFELLNYGVKQYPRYTAANILLAKELYEKGLVQDAWEQIKRVKAPLHDNILAQKIMFKVSILNEHESTAKSILQHMTHRRLLDNELELLGKELKLGGIQSAKSSLVNQFRKQGIKLSLPRDLHGLHTNSLEVPKSQKARPCEAFSFNDKVISDPSLKHYHVVPLSQIFHAKDEPQYFSKTTQTKKLESQTLAEIYKRQGHYEKSLEIYRRLLKISPGNDYLKRMVVELAKKSEAQQRKDLMIDPNLVEPEEQAQPKVKLYQQLLEKLSHEPSP